ncbi:hypothetical protein PHYPO_G00204490 [Pangasianodon hypophthalmus]|uniref:DUF4592 domain-containing protein n=1 Tax=Pangasianodon hypophthalmus TaxID=310915 RepID=A0A5N5PCL8_PANHP|nr:hypothetical protein PHYPO_G00204490 [Pangasianodon hypophthalmus]
MKKKGNVGVMKQSKSASDITRGILDLKDDFRCFQSRLGTRSLSHDSIFLSENRQSDPEPPRVLSQENGHRKIQALQMKLQTQKMHLGPPPLVLPIKQTEDHQHPTEVLTLAKNLPHKSHLKSSSQGVLPHPISPTLPRLYSSAPLPGVDFSTLPQFIPCLDNSAARHRMSIKPRNQRASTKSRRMPTSNGSRPRSESMIILERPLTESKEEDGIAVTKDMTRVRSYSSQIIRPGKGLTATPIKSPCPTSPLKLLVGANDDYHPRAVSQCKGKDEPAVSTTADKGTKQILKLAEGMVAKRPSEEGCLQEAITQQRSLSFSVSSDESHERQRTGSFTGHFTGQMEQAGGKREHVFPFIKLSPNLKTQDLHKNAQVKATGKDPSQTGATSTPAVSTKPRDLTITVTAGQERGESPANKPRDMAVETQEGVEEADEANKELKMNKVSKEKKEESSASEVKLHTTSQSEVTVKQHNTEVRSLSTRWLPESSTPIAVVQNDSKVGPGRETCTVLRSPPLYNTELFTSAESPVFSSIRSESARRDQERAGLIRFPDLQASAQSPRSPINITMSTPVCVMEKSPLQTSTYESREASTELSWMTMAREKTRSLQQLFTNTLNDLAGLQTATRPAASPLTQISSQPSAGSMRPKQQTSSAQPSVSPLETQLPTVHASVRATHPTQPPTQKSSISLAQPSVDQSGGVDFSLKQTLYPTSQVQTTHLGARPGQMSTRSATKPVQLTGTYISPTQFNSQIMHAAEQQLSQMSIHQAHPIQQSLPQSVTKPQSPQSLHLSLSPKLTPHQPDHQSPSPVSQPRPLGENLSSLPLGNVDWTSMPRGKSPAESQAQYAGGMGSRALFSEQSHHQKPDAVKVVGQKSTPDSRTYQSLDEFLTISSHRKFTELAVSPGPMRLDHEVKYQKKTLPPPSPSSSSCLQSNSDSRQPSWLELAKRKSMAWSDKTMD